MDSVNSFGPAAGHGYAVPDTKRAQNSKVAEFDSGDILLTIDDLLDFSNDDIGGQIEVVYPPAPATQLEVKFGACSSMDRKYSQAPSIFDTDGPIVPCDDLAELEWLSNFVEESFSSGDVPEDILEASVRAVGSECQKTNRGNKEQYGSASPVSVLESSPCSSGDVGVSFSRDMSVPGRARSKGCRTPVCFWNTRVGESLSTDMSVPGRARSKRCRTPVCFWNTRIFSADASASILESSSTSTSTAADPQSSDSDSFTYEQGGADSFSAKKLCKSNKQSKANKGLDAAPARRCLHCSIQRTPQWRSGPLGPKTLCNACGVRYKSGRLLPEYRPAASPTFVESIHSNSHRRVLEMRLGKTDELGTTHQPRGEIVPYQKMRMEETDELGMTHQPTGDIVPLLEWQ